MWRLALVVTGALFSSAFAGYILGYLSGTPAARGDFRLTVRQSHPFTNSAGPLDINIMKKGIRHLRNPDEKGLSMHTVFMSGCDRWQVNCF
jgi:hypothetical protein